MSDEKNPQDDVVESADAAVEAEDATELRPTGKRRRQGAAARPSAEEPTPEKIEKKDGFFARTGKGIVNFFKGLGGYFKSIWEQLRKVIWPTRKELIISIVAVFIFLVLSVLLVFGVDSGAGELVRLIFQDPNAGPGSAGDLSGLLPGM